jgi:PKHD-type hydroxylase
MYFFSVRSDSVGQPTFVANFLSAEECNRIISIVESSGQLYAGKTEDHQIHESLRKSDITWLNPDGEHRWLFERIRDCINAINADWFRYNLTGFEGIQFTKYSYKSRAGDFYSSHKDTATLPGGTIRKLSFTIQLSDPNSYGGGDVVLYSSLIESATLTRDIGSMSFFPSYTIHEVVPVNRGIRYSLVGWACGPAFV